MGSGVIPFAVDKQQVFFLFQKVFHGRKSGYLIDFGGGINEGETYQQAAAREFVEETETLFFEESIEGIKNAKKTPLRIARQLSIVTQLFNKTLQKNPHWYCHREPGNKVPPKDWKTFFVEFKYKDLSIINKEWELEEGQQTRFSKRRELHWIDAEHLLSIYAHHPEKLWKRVRQLMGARSVIQMIKQEKCSLPQHD
ncbi:MAG: NUDIX domain-containing protein [gamma proteobacterium symbiont of Taylorina sp.]|nr:NUDIX domain-containing protein [gamma proteobacterium symbiont of Taylorina sp.]